jgi:hypothetical protein
MEARTLDFMTESEAKMLSFLYAFPNSQLHAHQFGDSAISFTPVFGDTPITTGHISNVTLDQQFVQFLFDRVITQEVSSNCPKVKWHSSEIRTAAMERCLGEECKCRLEVGAVGIMRYSAEALDVVQCLLSS